MRNAHAEQQAAERILEVSRRGLDVAALWRACDEAIRPVVPFMLRPCWFTLDPSSLIVTSHYDAAVPALPPEYLRYEYANDDPMNLQSIARSAAGAATVHQRTGGEPAVSEGWRRFVEPFGADQQLAVALRTRTGSRQGVATLYREPGAPEFSSEDVAFLRSISADIAIGAARGLLVAETAEPGPSAPVLLVVDEQLRIRSMTPGTETLLGALPGGDTWRTRGVLPTVVLSMAGRVFGAGEAADGDRSARLRAEDGRWLTVHGAPLVSDGERRAAIIVERADADRISPLLMAAYGLTDREQQVTGLVLRGESTDDIAEDLHVSPLTVQEHLKHVFEKVGVHSRRDLVGRIFAAHYEPRVQDNDARVAAGRPILGGPVAATPLSGPAPT